MSFRVTLTSANHTWQCGAVAFSRADLEMVMRRKLVRSKRARGDGSSSCPADLTSAERRMRRARDMEGNRIEVHGTVDRASRHSGRPSGFLVRRDGACLRGRPRRLLRRRPAWEARPCVSEDGARYSGTRFPTVQNMQHQLPGERAPLDMRSGAGVAAPWKRMDSKWSCTAALIAASRHSLCTQEILRSSVMKQRRRAPSGITQRNLTRPQC